MHRLAAVFALTDTVAPGERVLHEGCTMPFSEGERERLLAAGFLVVDDVAVAEGASVEIVAPGLNDESLRSRSDRPAAEACGSPFGLGRTTRSVRRASRWSSLAPRMSRGPARVPASPENAPVHRPRRADRAIRSGPEARHRQAEGFEATSKPPRPKAGRGPPAQTRANNGNIHLGAGGAVEEFVSPSAWPRRGCTRTLPQLRKFRREEIHGRKTRQNTVCRHRRTGSGPAATWARPGRVRPALWNSIQTEYRIGDAGGVELLLQAAGAADRLAALGALISEQGEIVATAAGPKAHPGLKEELAFGGLSFRTLGRLGVTNEPVSSVGRPPATVGWRGSRCRLIDVRSRGLLRPRSRPRRSTFLRRCARALAWTRNGGSYIRG